MNEQNYCRRWEHSLSRRRMLGVMAGGTAGFASLTQPLIAEQLKQSDKQVLLMWLDGGLSQLESWDPKPNTRYGGPFRTIPTSVTGTHICELLPRVAKQMHHLAVVRSMKTEDNSHSSGVPRILRGDPKNRGVTYPYMGAAVAKLMGPMESGLPPYVWVKPGNGGFIPKHAGFLGAKYGAFAIGSGKPPENLRRPEVITEDSDAARHELREKLNQRYAARHRPAASEANAFVYDVAQTLIKHENLFDETTLDPKDVERYGNTELGRNTLLGRRLLEAGVRFVHVQSYGWDTHGDNFNAHASRVPKVDWALSSLIEDLAARDMLQNVLVIVMGEFGRTPRINGAVGRDHWPNAWSLAMAGSRIRAGVTYGTTLDDGTDVATNPCDIGHLFHTWYQALGIDPAAVEFLNGTQPLPIAHDDMHAVKELLA